MISILARIYVVFSLFAVSTGLIAAWAGGDDLLRSDDPYLVGIFLGSVAGTFSLVYFVVKRLAPQTASRNAAEIACFGVLSLWSGFIWLATRRSNEAAELGAGIAVVSLAIGALTWPLCRFQLHPVAARVIGLLGAAFIGGYAYVAFQMAQRVN